MQEIFSRNGRTKTFERVVVQNILHGLSPSLSDAIASVSRWTLIRAALPHVVQCCGSLLEASDSRGLSISLQKILYILHWMLLDSASECAEVASKDEPSQPTRGQGLFAISSIQLFVYLIAPLADTVSEEDISSNIRLESGLKLWQALWQLVYAKMACGERDTVLVVIERDAVSRGVLQIVARQRERIKNDRFRQPDVWCFTAPVKQRRNELPQVMFVRQSITPSIPLIQGVYLGDQDAPRRPSVVPPPKPPRTDQAVLDEKRRREREKQKELEQKQGVSAEYVETVQVSLAKPSSLAVDVLEKPTTTWAPGIVRSVSEYKTGESMIPSSRLSKSNTANAFDSSPTSESSLRVLEEVNSTLKFAEDGNSLSGVFCPHDAPIVHISDVCSGCSQEISDNLVLPVAMTYDSRQSEPLYERVPASTCESEDIPKPDVQRTPPVVLTRAPVRDDTISSSSQHTVIHAQPIPTPSEAVHLPEACIHDESATVKRTDTASTDDELDEYGQPDPMVATILDVAVIRALLITHWREQGIYWALRYLLNRLEQIQNHVTIHGTRLRSNSLPPGERKASISVVQPSYVNTTWEDFQLKGDENDRSKLHVAFNDNSCPRRKSSDQGYPRSRDHHSRRSSLNTLTRRERNRSDPSLNNSCEIASIREDSTSMNSSRSDRHRISAKYYPEILGSSSFIEKDGRLSLTVIVQTINQVMEKSCVANICELALNIADTLLRIPLDHTETFFSELTTMIFRIYLALGCPHGCNEGVKSQQGNFLRIKAKNILAQLEKLQQERFRSIFVLYVEENNPQQILDLIHSITAFCRSEFPQLTSIFRWPVFTSGAVRNITPTRFPLVQSPFVTVICSKHEEVRRHPESKAPSYRNRFNEREKGIEGRIINATLRNLTTKLALIHDQLIQPENMSLLGDVRMLVNFIQEQHGNPFRRVALSALLDAVDQMPKVESSEISRKDESEKSSPGGLAPPARGDQASLRRGLFKRKEKVLGTL
ncbi:Unc-80p [Parelaphostrongylus tenuis]|uniref:Unc-80p n=1 Tax=Parelaphostrongylus tenuis TaxID=148309 RepID=A0AAD5N6M0_PARTN|nr:Unc-80p [Parelaphostrongylus tenuis]